MLRHLFTLNSERVERESQSAPQVATPPNTQDGFPEIKPYTAPSYAAMSPDVAELVGIPLSALDTAPTLSKKAEYRGPNTDRKIIAAGLAVTILTTLGIYHIVDKTSERDMRKLDELQEQLDQCYGAIPAELQGTDSGELRRQQCVQEQLHQEGER